MSEEWIARWVREFGTPITQFLYTFTRDRELAQDLAQDTFVRLYRFHAANPARGVHAGWLYTTARRLAIDAQRRRQRQPETLWDPQSTESGIAIPGDPDIEDTVTRRLAVQATLDRLPRRDREILWLFYYQGWSVRSIAQRMHRSEDGVRMRLHRARQRFAKLWGGTVDGETRVLGQ